MAKGKVFGIGLAKTGVSSLSEALRILGYNTIQYPLDISDVRGYDAATDISVSARFEFLDTEYPGSKFIYTTRNMDDWLLSSQRHWERIVSHVRDPAEISIISGLYNGIEFDKERFRKVYLAHEDRVRHYFRGRERDLLVANFCDGRDGWKELCAFLDASVPDQPFPHENPTTFWRHLRYMAALFMRSAKSVSR